MAARRADGVAFTGIGAETPRRRPRMLSRRFFQRSTLVVARELLGKVLVHETVEGCAAGIVVEVEAYIGEDDPACHAAPGPTPRNRPLYGPAGFAYVYLNYGMHRLFNVVTERAGVPAAVLIRALEPCAGVDLMQLRRAGAPTTSPRDLCRGPGRLTRALGIDLAHNARDLTTTAARHALRFEDWGVAVAEPVWGPRVGIRVGTERDWRCSVPGHPCVSPWRAGALRPRRQAAVGAARE